MTPPFRVWMSQVTPAFPLSSAQGHLHGLKPQQRLKTPFLSFIEGASIGSISLTACTSRVQKSRKRSLNVHRCPPISRIIEIGRKSSKICPRSLLNLNRQLVGPKTDRWPMAWVKHSLSNSESQHAAYGKIWKNMEK